MANKHKSKYKRPENTKHKPRKDLKDYLGTDAENMVPGSTGEPQKNVLRKTDKEVIDNGCLVPDVKDSDRVYKTDGDHDPKHSAKKMKKLQDDNEIDSLDDIKNLTREQKENALKKYIRHRISDLVTEAKKYKLSTYLEKLKSDINELRTFNIHVLEESTKKPFILNRNKVIRKKLAEYKKVNSILRKI